MKECKPGYYVNDEWFGEKISQARARARHLANELPGKVDVIHQAEDGELRIVSTHEPNNMETKRTDHYKPASVPDTLASAIHGGEMKAGTL